MKKVGVFLGFFLIMIVLLAVPTAAARLDFVDIGDETSESGHLLKGWGPIEPAASGGHFGGVENCRVTWEPGAPDTTRARTASFMLKSKGQASRLILMVLDGHHKDSFEVYVYKVNKLVRHYIYEGNNIYEEKWIPHDIEFDRSVGGKIKVEIIAVGEAWDGFDTYGQLAVDYAELLSE